VLKCHFVDDGSSFFPLLVEKLGVDVEFSRLEIGPDVSSSDTVLIRVPAKGDPRCVAALQQLTHLVRTVGMPPVIALVPSADWEMVRTVLNHGAYDSFGESGSLTELNLVLRRAAQFWELTREVHRFRQEACVLPNMLSADESSRAVLDFAAKVAPTDATILLTGETGTGKGVLARAIHDASQRRAHPFVAVACSALPETLIEAELFGHEKGAFTGAGGFRRGRFEAAGQGTIFLDEIGELSPGLQIRLLRVLQERTIERLGSNDPIPIHARVICATNRNLQELIKASTFRLDLYYRLNTIEIELPPLRHRRDDIALLANEFLRFFADRHQRPARRICLGVLTLLEEYSWPGNIRELENVVERAVVLCDEPEIGFAHLPPRFRAQDIEFMADSFEDEVKNFKRRLIQRTLVEYQHNKVQAARSLKIARSSLHRLIEELSICSPDRQVH
jgi:DNA-binding NtrC family response regulator